MPNIGRTKHWRWFPIKNSLAFEYDYQYMIDEIINQIKIACDEAEVDVPNIFTEFGSFTVEKVAVPFIRYCIKNSKTTEKSGI